MDAPRLVLGQAAANPCPTNRFSGDEDEQPLHIAAPVGAMSVTRFSVRALVISVWMKRVSPDMKRVTPW